MSNNQSRSVTPYQHSVIAIIVTFLSWALIVGLFAIGFLFLPIAHAKTSQELVMQTRQCFLATNGVAEKEQQCREAYLTAKRTTNANTLQKIKQSESYQQGADKRQLTGSQQ